MILSILLFCLQLSTPSTVLFGMSFVPAIAFSPQDTDSGRRRALHDHQRHITQPQTHTNTHKNKLSPKLWMGTWKTRITLRISPQQLGEFEPITLETDSLQKVEDRTVRLINCVGKAGIIDEENETTPSIPFLRAWKWQQNLVGQHVNRLKHAQERGSPSQWHQRCDGASRSYQHVEFGVDTVLMLQHEPVYTLGTASDPKHILSSTSSTTKIETVRTERGGEVTYHGPGQLTVYPILDLRGYRQDIHWYMRALEETVILALRRSGIENATREDDVTGVWVQGKKVAAAGVKVSKWITMHGIAVNVDRRSLDHFDGIVPCGLVDRPQVGCLNQFQPTPLPMDCFADQIKLALEEVFQIVLVEEDDIETLTTYLDELDG